MNHWRKVGWRSARHRSMPFVVRFNQAGRGIGKILGTGAIGPELFNALVKEAETVWPELQQQEQEKLKGKSK